MMMLMTDHNDGDYTDDEHDAADDRDNDDSYWVPVGILHNSYMNRMMMMMTIHRGFL